MGKSVHKLLQLPYPTYNDFCYHRILYVEYVDHSLWKHVLEYTSVISKVNVIIPALLSNIMPLMVGKC